MVCHINPYNYYAIVVPVGLFRLDWYETENRRTLALIASAIAQPSLQQLYLWQLNHTRDPKNVFPSSFSNSLS